MAKCVHCGKDIDILDAFCKYCGASNKPKDNYKYNGKEAVKIEIKPEVITSKPPEDKALGVLAYFLLLNIFPLLKCKEDKYLRFHVNNGLVVMFIHLIGYFVIYALRRVAEELMAVNQATAAYILNVLIVPVFLVLCIIIGVPLVGCLKGRRWKVPLFGWIQFLL